MQPTVATSHALSSLSLSVYLRETVYFTNLLLALRYVGIAKLALAYRIRFLGLHAPAYLFFRLRVALEPACWLELENFDYSRNLV